MNLYCLINAESADTRIMVVPLSIPMLCLILSWYHQRLPKVISGYLDHQSTQFRLSASEQLLFVSMVLVLINALYTEFQIAMTLSLSNSFIMTKRPFPYIILLFEQFNMLQLCVSLCLNSVLVTGHCGCKNIKVPSVKNPELTNAFP